MSNKITNNFSKKTIQKKYINYFISEKYTNLTEKNWEIFMKLMSYNLLFSLKMNKSIKKIKNIQDYKINKYLIFCFLSSEW